MADMAKAIREAVQMVSKIPPRKEYVLLCNIEEYDSVKEAIDRTDVMVMGYQLIEKGKAYIMERSEWAKICEVEVCEVEIC